MSEKDLENPESPQTANAVPPPYARVYFRWDERKRRRQRRQAVWAFLIVVGVTGIIVLTSWKPIPQPVAQQGLPNPIATPVPHPTPTSASDDDGVIETPTAPTRIVPRSPVRGQK